MLRRSTQNKQVTLPREFLEQLNLHEGDYVALECEGDAIRLRAPLPNEFTQEDYKQLAARLDRVKEEPGKYVKESEAARNHMKSMMK